MVLGGDALVDPCPQHGVAGVAVGVHLPGPGHQGREVLGYVLGARGVLLYGGRGDRRRRAQAELQRFGQQRGPRQPRAAAVADGGGAVAFVEGRRQGVRLEADLGQQGLGGPAAPQRSGDGGRGVAVLDQAAQQHLDPGEEFQQRERGAGDAEERPVLREELQPPALVAGQGAELDVQADLLGHAGLAPGEAVAHQVVRAGLVGAAEAQQRQQRLCLADVRLLRTALAAAEHRGPDVEGALIVARAQVVQGPVPGLAGLAVAHALPGPGDPQVVRGELTGPGVRGDAVAHGGHRLHAVSGFAVPLAHLAGPPLDGGQRDLGHLEQGGGHPLEAPEDLPRLPFAEGAGLVVPHLQQTGEDDR